MIKPTQFHINEAWIAFKLNDVPILTESDGDFNVIALMDAASCFMLATEFVPANSEQLSQLEAKRLLKSGYAHKQALPKTLLIPTNQPASLLIAEAEKQNIEVVCVAEKELLMSIREARDGFREHFSTRGQ